jgi:hypothetical protein
MPIGTTIDRQSPELGLAFTPRPAERVLRAQGSTAMPPRRWMTPTAPSSLVGRPEHKPYRVFTQTQNACEPDALPGSECSERVFNNASKEGKDATPNRAFTQTGVPEGHRSRQACVPAHPAPGLSARATTRLHTPHNRNQSEVCQIWAQEPHAARQGSHPSPHRSSARRHSRGKREPRPSCGHRADRASCQVHATHARAEATPPPIGGSWAVGASATNSSAALVGRGSPERAPAATITRARAVAP